MQEIWTTTPQLELPSSVAEHLPLFDKSWVIRLGLLDALAGNSRMIDFLETAAEERNIGEDLEALVRVSKQWQTGEPLEVGESGTIYRFFQFAAWLEQDQSPEAPERAFIKSGSLAERTIADNPDIIHWTIPELLTLDGETTQWASVAALLRNEPGIYTYSDEPKYQLSLEAKRHWYLARINGEPWEARADETIERQASAYYQALKHAVCDFTPLQAEDYCFARAYGRMTAKEAEARWPKLHHHESDRIVAMERAMEQAAKQRSKELIDVNDHRVVQAIAMRFGLPKERFKYPDCVAKSWPSFWEFREAAQREASAYIASY